MRPTFVLTFDTELMWGSFDHTPESRFARTHPDMRGIVSDLLTILEEQEVSATWALVGHLFLSACAKGSDGRAHSEIQRPTYSWYPKDWLAEDPCGNRVRYPLWYGDDIVDLILAARVPQEVGSHSFSHLILGDPGCSEAAAAADIAECVKLANGRGLTLRSFVFPRNLEGHHRVLARQGFTAYRGEDPTWFRPLHGRLKRAAHLLDQAAGLPPPVSTPREILPGLWNIPGSMLLLHRSGVRRMIPFRTRVYKARAGLRRAVREGKVFHLWTHPENMAWDRAGMLDALSAIIHEAVRLRGRGVLDIRTMGQVAASLSRSAPGDE